MRDELALDLSRKRKTLLLTSWHAYSRPSVLNLEKDILKIRARGEGAIMLPCSFKRPYGESPTHRRIYSQLKQCGYAVENSHRIVVTSLGVIPQEVWSSPAVMQYDAGVPDIYRLLRLLRDFFTKRHYKYVIDCLEFPPYSDLLRIVQREGLIGDLRRLDRPKRRAFYVRPLKMLSVQ
jgi:predicted RNA-binding protein